MNPTTDQAAAPDSPAHVLFQMRDADVIQAPEDVERRLDSLLESGPRTLVVDMSGVVDLSSATMAALLCVRRRCSSRGVDVVLSDVPRHQVGALRRIGLRGAAVTEVRPGWARLVPTGRSVPRRSS